jgi:DNA-binding MarR family transcriptional regulator
MTTPQFSMDSLRALTRSLIRELGALHPDRLGAQSLTLAEGHALKEIEAHGEVSIKELSKSLLLDQSTTSRMASRLEASKYIRITSDPIDKRAKILSLSSHGKTSLKTLDEKTNHFLSRALKMLSKKDQIQLISSMMKYRDALQKVRQS